MPEVIVDGGLLERAFRVLLGERLSVGRGAGSDLVIPDARLSRRHAEIRREPDGYYVRDLGSRNGTILNGSMVRGEAKLKPGDVIIIGDYVLAFRAEGTTQLATEGQPPPAALLSKLADPLGIEDDTVAFRPLVPLRVLLWFHLLVPRIESAPDDSRFVSRVAGAALSLLPVAALATLAASLPAKMTLVLLAALATAGVAGLMFWEAFRTLRSTLVRASLAVTGAFLIYELFLLWKSAGRLVDL